MFHAPADKRMILRNTRGMETERTGFEFALCHLLTKEFKELFVLIEFIGSYIYDKVERVGDDIVLGA